MLIFFSDFVTINIATLRVALTAEIAQAFKR